MGVNWHLEEIESQLQAEVAKRDEREAWKLVMDVLKRGGGGPGGVPSADAGLPEYRESTDPEFEDLERPKEGDVSVTVDEKKRGTKKRKLSKLLEDVAKASTGTEAVQAVSKKELAEAVIAKARARAARNGTTVEKEESALWREIYSRPQPQMDYDANVLKYETPTRGTTKAEIALDGLAKAIMKRDGSSFAQSYNSALRERPELYADYIREVNEGATFEAPEPAEYKASGFLSRSEQIEIAKRRAKAKRTDPGTTMNGDLDSDGDESEDDDPMNDDDDAEERLKRGGRRAKSDRSALECTSCGSENSAENNYCGHCGSRLEKE
jgi:hypothetical protein